MAAVNTASVIGAELEKVRKGLPKLFDEDVTFYSKIERKNVEVISKRDMRIPIALRPGGYFGMFNSDGGELGRGAGPQYDKAVINTNDYRYAVEYTKQADWGTNTPQKSVAQVVQKLTANAVVELRRAIDCMYQTDGTGVLGAIGTFTGTGPYTINLTTGTFGASLLRYGQKIDVYSSDLTTKRTSTAREITTYDLENNQIIINGGAIASISNGDLLVVEGATGTPPVSLYGIPYHATNSATGTWLGFNRATTPEVRANRVNAGGSGFVLPLPRLAVNKVMLRLGQDRVMKYEAWMHPCQAAAYEDTGQLVSIIQKQAKAEGLDMYFGDIMQMAGATVKKHIRWNKTRIDFMNMSNWGRAEMHPVDFYKTDGRKLFEVRASDGGLVAADLFYVVVSMNTYVDNPAELTYIDNLAVPSGY